MSLPYFCLGKLVWASVTSMTGSPCCTHGRKIILGANAYTMRNPWPLSIVVVCTLRLPVIFLWEEKLVASLIATPNLDKFNRRQTRKAKELGHMLGA
jgi:hypothetical protein